MRAPFGRTFPINRLFFRYILGAPWEQTLTVERLAHVLKSIGMIELSEGGTRYEELTPFRRYSHRTVFIKHFNKLKTRFEEISEGEL